MRAPRARSDKIDHQKEEYAEHRGIRIGIIKGAVAAHIPDNCTTGLDGLQVTGNRKEEVLMGEALIGSDCREHDSSNRSHPTEGPKLALPSQDAAG